jgi:phosphoglycolate phosphatase-like HAD superfamily hydrolase
LKALLDDQAAPIEARRAAGETMRRVIREGEKAVRPIGSADEPLTRWVSGLDIVPDPFDGRLLVRILASEDALIRHLGRDRLRRARVPEVRALVEAIFRPVETVENVIKVLDALAATGILTPAGTVDMALDTAQTASQAVLERLFCCAFGLSDQKWGKELVRALESLGSDRGIAPLPHLSALFSTLQRHPTAARRLLASTPFPADLRAALAASSHPNVRRLGE